MNLKISAILNQVKLPKLLISCPFQISRIRAKVRGGKIQVTYSKYFNEVYTIIIN